MVSDDQIVYGERGVIYTVGFLFDFNERALLLIRKSKPEWQAGLLNGIGGKALPGEDNPYYAMHREAEEETGITRSRMISDWRHSLVLAEPKYHLHVFKAVAPLGILRDAVEQSAAGRFSDSERLELVNIDAARTTWEGFVPNLRWIVPFLLHSEYYSPTTVLVDDSLESP